MRCAYRLIFFYIPLDCVQNIYIVSIFFNFFFIIIIFPFHTIFFFFLHFYLEIYYSILCGTLKSHIAFVRLVSPLRLSFYVFFPMPKENSCFHKNTTKYTREGYQYVQSLLWGYYESKNGEKKAPRKDTQTSVVMGWLLTKTTIMCAHKRSHE